MKVSLGGMFEISRRLEVSVSVKLLCPVFLVYTHTGVLLDISHGAKSFSIVINFVRQMKKTLLAKYIGIIQNTRVRSS